MKREEEKKHLPIVAVAANWLGVSRLIDLMCLIHLHAKSIHKFSSSGWVCTLHLFFCDWTLLLLRAMCMIYTGLKALTKYIITFINPVFPSLSLSVSFFASYWITWYSKMHWKVLCFLMSQASIVIKSKKKKKEKDGPQKEPSDWASGGSIRVSTRKIQSK